MTALAAAVALFGMSAGAQPGPDPELENAAERRFLSAEQFYAGGRHAQALRDFEAILDSMATTRVADDAALRIARHRFEMEGDEAAAETMVDRLLREFPAGDAVPGAHFLRGEIAAAATPPRLLDARADFERVLTSAGPAETAWSFDALVGIADIALALMDDEAAAGALLAALHETAPAPGDRAARREARLLLARALARQGNTGAALTEIAGLRAEALDVIATADPGSEAAVAAAALAERASDFATLLGRFGRRGAPEWRVAGALSPPRRLDEPVRLRFADGQLHVLDRDLEELQSLSLEAEFVRAFGLDDPRDVAFTLEVSSPAGEPLAIVAAEDILGLGGNVLPMEAPATRRARPLDRMRAVTASLEGFWVWDDREKAVFSFALSGASLGRTPHGPLEDVLRIGRHPAGWLMVIDEEQGVLAFDADGARIFQVAPDAGMPEPVDFAFDELGNLYVLERSGPTLSVRDASFRPVVTLRGSEWTGGQVREPISLDVGPDGTLFILDEATRAVVVLE